MTGVVSYLTGTSVGSRRKNFTMNLPNKGIRDWKNK